MIILRYYFSMYEIINAIYNDNDHNSYIAMSFNCLQQEEFWPLLFTQLNLYLNSYMLFSLFMLQQ